MKITEQYSNVGLYRFSQNSGYTVSKETYIAK